jgi:hypothetical protein
LESDNIRLCVVGYKCSALVPFPDIIIRNKIFKWFRTCAKCSSYNLKIIKAVLCQLKLNRYKIDSSNFWGGEFGN